MQNDQLSFLELHNKIIILAEKIVITSQKKKISIASAESCTGGAISYYLTTINGASKIFRGGICAYQDQVKTNLLHISQDTLDHYTAVSAQTAQEMAENAQKEFSCDYAISTTGYAGPTGGDEQNPVGTVFIAVASKDACITKKLYFPNHTREEIQLLVTHHAFAMLDCILNS